MRWLVFLAALRPAAAIVLLFTAPVTQGNFGNRATASAQCQAWSVCANPVAFVTYSTDSVWDQAALMTQNTPLYSLLSIVLGDNSTYAIWDGSAIATISAIETQLGAESSSLNWWSGYLPNGTITGSNCNDWTSNSPTDFATQWPTGLEKSCDNLFPLMCMCDFGGRRLTPAGVRRLIAKADAQRRLQQTPRRDLATTRSPTHKPTTHAPSHRPTTAAPTTPVPTSMYATLASQCTTIRDKQQDYADRAASGYSRGADMAPGNYQDTVLGNADAFAAHAAALGTQAAAMGCA